MEPKGDGTTGQIHIVEVGDEETPYGAEPTGPTRSAQSLQSNLGAGPNPFVVTLWVLGLGLVVLSLLLIVAASYTDIGRGSFASNTIDGMRWLSLFQPFAVQGFSIGVAVIATALVLQAARWDRRRPQQ